MPVPFLVPIIGSLIGTAAAPAIGMSAALAAGLGGGIATLAAGGSPGEALMSGLTGGIGGGLVSGIAGVAGKGAEAAAGAAAQAGTGGAAAVAPKMAESTIHQALSAQPAIASVGDQLTQGAIRGAAGKGIDPMKAMQFASKIAGGEDRPQQSPTLQTTNLPMNAGGNSVVGSAQAMQNFTQMQPGDRQMQSQPGVESVIPQSDFNRIQLRFARGGLASLAGREMAQRGMDRLPNLGNREQAFMAARREFARGGYIEGPGTGTSDDIDAVIYQNGVPVEEAMLSDGEFVMTEKAVKGAGAGDRNKGAAKMYEMMRQFEGAA